MTLDLDAIRQLARKPRHLEQTPDDEWLPIPALAALWQATAVPAAPEAREPLDVAAALAGVPEGERDTMLWRLACRARHFGLPIDWTKRLLAEAAGNCSPAFDEAIALEKADRAYASYAPAPVPDVPDASRDRESGTAARVWELAEPAPRRFSVPGLVPDSAVTLLFGDGGTGKSYLAHRICHDKARGTPFAGLELGREVVLYADGELELEEFTRRAYALARGAGFDRPPEGLHYLQLPGPLSDPAVMETVQAEIRRVGATFIALDSLTISCYGVDPSDPQAVTSVVKRIEKWGTVLAVDHIPKPAPGANLSHYRAFGSVFKHNLARSVIQVVQADGGALTLRQAKTNFGPLAAPLHLAMEFGTDGVTFDRLDDGDERLAGLEDHLPGLERVALALAEHEEPVAPELLAERLGLTVKSVRNYLTVLRRKGRATRVSEGLWGAVRKIPNSRSPKERDFGKTAAVDDPLLALAQRHGWPEVVLFGGDAVGPGEASWAAFVDRADRGARVDAFAALDEHHHRDEDVPS